MSVKKQTVTRTWPRRHPWVWLLAGLPAAHGGPGTQTLITTPTLPPALPVAAQQDVANNEMNVFTPAGVVNEPSTQPFQFGQVLLRPHLTYLFNYGTGIQSGPGVQQNTILEALSPGLTVNLGTHWSLDYTPTLNFYSNSKFHDTVDHSGNLSWATHYEDWNFSLSQTFSLSSAPITETAAQTDQQSYTTALSAAYAFNDALSADFGLNQSLNFVSGLQDSREWSTMDWLNYSLGNRLNFGVGIGGGYVNVVDSFTGVNNPDQTYETMQGRVNWRAGNKVSFQLSAGFEDRQFQSAGVGDSLNPIFGATIQYQAFSHTEISLSANRTVGSSDFYLVTQTTENTSINLSLNQRLLGSFNLNLTLGYNQNDYTVALGPLSGNRTDDGYSFTAGLSRTFLKRGSWSVTYQYNDNQSSVAGYGYGSNQVGFQVSYSY